MKNWIALLLFTGLIIAGCTAPETGLSNGSQDGTQAGNGNATGQQGALLNAAFVFSIKGCAETEKGMAVRSGGLQMEKPPEIKASGSRIAYYRALSHLCCRKAIVEKEFSGQVINFYEVWSGLGCRCMCFSEISANVSGLPPGEYTVNVLEKGTEPSGEPMPQNLLISVNVSIQ